MKYTNDKFTYACDTQLHNGILAMVVEVLNWWTMLSPHFYRYLYPLILQHPG